MKKIYNLKALLPFHDLENEGVKRIKNEEFECSKERALQLIYYKKPIVELISIIKKNGKN